MDPTAGSGGARAARPRSVPSLGPGDRVTVTYDCGARLTSGVVRDAGRLVLDIPGGHFVVCDADGALAPDIASLERVAPLEPLDPA